MPVGNARFESPRRDLWSDDPAARWTVPVGRLGRTRFGLSYTVFIAAAIVFAIALTFSARPGNADLVRVTALGTGFWISGWLVQSLSYLALTWLLGLPLPQLNIGLLGVEPMPRNWTTGRTLITALAALGSLLLLGGFYRMVEGGFQVPSLSPVPQKPLTAPSIGFASPDSIWWSGAWLCWVQAVCQIYPLPRTLGRLLVGACCGVAAGRFDVSIQTVIFRRCIAMIAFLTLMLSVVLMSVEADRVFPQWSLLAMLGVLLWLSARGSDLPTILLGFEAAEATETRPGLVARIREVIRSRRNHKRLQETLQQERNEAIEASRLDEILTQLHRDGIESLAPEDRRILERVSESLRQRRQAGSDSADEVGE